MNFDLTSLALQGSSIAFGEGESEVPQPICNQMSAVQMIFESECRLTQLVYKYLGWGE